MDSGNYSLSVRRIKIQFIFESASWWYPCKPEKGVSWVVATAKLKD